MEIKVIHNCGTKFAFDVEPENGAMPFAIQCPSCGQDATEDANAIIAQALAASAAPAAAVPPPPPPPPAPKPGLKLGRSHPPTVPAVEQQPKSAPEPAAAPATTAAKPARKSGGFFASDEPHLPMAVTGAAIGALIGMGVWWALMHYLHIRSGLVAWGVGALCGFGVRALGRAPTQLFGVIAVVFALLAIGGGQYIAIRQEVTQWIAEGAKEEYDRDLALANKVATAKDDASLRKVLAAQNGDDGPGEVTDEELKELKKELPRLKELANGKPTREQFESAHAKKVQDEIPMGLILATSFGLFKLIFIGLGVASAYKIGAGVGS